MATPPCRYQNKLKVAAILISFVALFFPSKSVGLGFGGYKTGSGGHVLNGRDDKLQVGSRPPACVNKCSGCRPCKATLVIQPSPRHQTYTTPSSSHSQSHSHDGDGDGDGDGGGGGGDIYYLLLWKCKCGNKLYRP